MKPNITQIMNQNILLIYKTPNTISIHLVRENWLGNLKFPPKIFLFGIMVTRIRRNKEFPWALITPIDGNLVPNVDISYSHRQGIL